MLRKTSNQENKEDRNGDTRQFEVDGKAKQTRGSKSVRVLDDPNQTERGVFCVCTQQTEIAGS